MRRGQLLVELAVALPLILFILLGATETGFLLIAKAGQDHATRVVAEWAGQHPGEAWSAVADRELPGCSVEVTTPLPDVVEAASRCQYVPKVTHGLWPGLVVSSRESAAAVH